MLAKLIVSAPSRPAAIARLRRALNDYAVLGVTTNLPLLAAIAAHPLFADGATTTAFLDDSGLLELDEKEAVPAEVLVAAAIGDTLDPSPGAEARAADPWQVGPWRALGDAMPLRYTSDGQAHTILVSRMREGWRATLASTSYTVRVVAARPGELLLEINGERMHFARARDGGAQLVAWRGSSYRLARDAGLSLDALGQRATGAAGHASLAAPMPGTVIKVLVAPGDQVAARQPLVVLEAMKMEHVVAAPHAGLVEQVHCAAGALVAKGALLVELDETAERV